MSACLAEEYQAILTKVRQELKAQVDPAYHQKETSFSKEAYQAYGVHKPVVRKLAAKYWQQLKKKLTKDQVFALADYFCQDQINEEITVAWDWIYRLKNHYETTDFPKFFHWLEEIVDTWFYCDDLCCRSFGHFIFKFPEFAPEVLTWSKSQNRWLQRASAVVLI